MRRLGKAFSRAPRNGGAGAEGFDTAALSAAASRAAIVDRQVAALGGASCSAVVDTLVKDDTGSNARAQRCVEHVAVANSGAPDSLGKCGGIPVVVDTGGETEDAMHLGGQREISPARQVGRVENY